VHVAIYDMPLGQILIASDSESITWVSFEEKPPARFEQNPDSLTDKAAAQIDEYLSGKRQAFDLPIAPRGTEFQLKVWNALQAIPYGETRTYKQIAEEVGNPKACRAVGMANNKNPLSIIVPCHRVIGSSGSLVGYAGGLGVKKRLLEMEQRKG
jgi:methylated-DNA-[protein]-cysteine S-methyltransferase